MNLSNSCLLICDIQERFSSSIFAFNDVVDTANKMIQFSNATSMPFVVTEQYPKAFGSTVQSLDIKNAQLVESKTKFSMFTPNVATKLDELKIKNLIIVGLESHICVTQTVLDLLENHFHVYVLVDGVSSANPLQVKIALDRLRNCGATITTSDSIMFQLVRDSTHPKFKSMSAIVKANLENENKLLTMYSSCKI